MLCQQKQNIQQKRDEELFQKGCDSKISGREQIIKLETPFKGSNIPLKGVQFKNEVTEEIEFRHRLRNIIKFPQNWKI